MFSSRFCKHHISIDRRIIQAPLYFSRGAMIKIKNLPKILTFTRAPSCICIDFCLVLQFCDCSSVVLRDQHQFLTHHYNLKSCFDFDSPFGFYAPPKAVHQLNFLNSLPTHLLKYNRGSYEFRLKRLISVISQKNCDKSRTISC